MKSMLGLAISITAEQFASVTDKGGVPYIMHCLYVMDNTEGDDCVKCAAVMHDLIEDNNPSSPVMWTFEKLSKVGFSEKTVRLLKLVTHRDGETYDEYIKRVSEDLEAIGLKKSDLEHNSCITRLKGVRPKDHQRIEKYHKSYKFLCEAEACLLEQL